MHMQQVIKDISEKALEIATQHELTIIAPCAHEAFDPEKHEMSLREAVLNITPALCNVVAIHHCSNDDSEIFVKHYYAENDHDVSCFAFEIVFDGDSVAIFVCDEIDVKAYLDFVRAALEVMKNTRAQ